MPVCPSLRIVSLIIWSSRRSSEGVSKRTLLFALPLSLPATAARDLLQVTFTIYKMAITRTTVEGNEQQNINCNTTSQTFSAQSSPGTEVHCLSKDLQRQGGDGAESHAINSTGQGQSILPLLTEALYKIELSTQSSVHGGPLVVTVADLGCSSGPNCLRNVNTVISCLQKRYKAQDGSDGKVKLPTPEFQVFLQDLPMNDFNYLFEHVTEEVSDDDSSEYFTSAVAGSFYERLFPQSSVHVFFSSYCLHWLSKIPAAVLDKRSPAYNKGRSWVLGASEDVVAAYREQSASDLRAFLSVRAKELVRGGLLFFSFVCRRQSDPTRSSDLELFGELIDLMDVVWDEMVSERIVSENVRDAFNLSSYLRSFDDAMDVVGSFVPDLFRIERMEVLPAYHFSEGLVAKSDVVMDSETPKSCGEKVFHLFKSTRAAQIQNHIGLQRSNIFWYKFSLAFFRGDLVNKCYKQMKQPGKPFDQMVISLIRQ